MCQHRSDRLADDETYQKFFPTYWEFLQLVPDGAAGRRFLLELLAEPDVEALLDDGKLLAVAQRLHAEDQR